MRTRNHLLCIPFVSCLLIACSSSDPGETKEITYKDSVEAATSETEDELFVSARQLYSDGLYSAARETFEVLHAAYPLGAYANFSEIKIADCYFEAGEYASAATAYESFLSNHPKNLENPYVSYRVGLSLFRANRGIGKDSSSLVKAIGYFEQTISRFPNSQYAASARRALLESNQLLAGHKMEVIDFYKNQGMQAAYEDRMQDFKQEFAAYLDSEGEFLVEPENQQAIQLADLHRSRFIDQQHQDYSTARGSYGPRRKRRLIIERPLTPKN